jgi:glycosyltransferase involved in cell wall biosynthesis
MNNIEMAQLKKDIQEYLGYSLDDVDNIGVLTDKKLHTIKRDIERIKKKNLQTTKEMHQKNILERKLKEALNANLGIKAKKIVKNSIKQPKPKKINSSYYIEQSKPKRIPINKDSKPKILFISDVKGWAWWNKSLILKKYLSDEFDIDVKAVLGEGSTPANRIDQTAYDLYFTYGFSYIDFLYRVPKFKKSTGVTAHRSKNVIFPKMKMADHIHANSMMLLNELHSMGFKHAHYVPNGVEEELFKPLKPIREDGELIVGHVGKKCAKKCQETIILPAIKKANVKSHTNLRTWKDKIPLEEMPHTYNSMDLFLVASDEDGTPNPALEAAACGRPIISNRIGNMPEFIIDGYNGFLVPKKIDAYVEKINYFKENRDELIRMGDNARKTVLEDWTWAKQSEHYRNMFNSIFERK